MKIVVGMGCAEDYEEYVKAGADEIYLGAVPGEYFRNFGNEKPLNRREVMYCNVQAGAESELLILKDMIKDFGVPCTVVFNSLSYERNVYDKIEEYAKKLISMGFASFITADHELFLHLMDIKGAEVILSGEFGEINHFVTELLKRETEGKEGFFKRIIFPRQTKILEMKTVIEKASAYPEEFEAFVLNEKCHFTGAYCNSFHCDELCHMCHLPYRMERKDKTEQILKHEAFSKEKINDEENDIPGSSGCALCSLWKLRDAGITHLKVVSRGNDTVSAVNDIKVLKKALCILEESENEEIYIKKIKEEIFPAGCSNNCYYC